MESGITPLLQEKDRVINLLSLRVGYPFLLVSGLNEIQPADNPFDWKE